MRKLFALLFVAGTLAVTSCGEKKATEEAKADSTAAPATEAMPAAPDTTMKADSMAAPAAADTMKK